MRSPHQSVPDSAPMQASEELFAPIGPGVELCYQTFGDPDGDPLVLVMGLGGPMTWWEPELCRMLAEQGFYVVRFDNRDVGRSSRVGGRVTRSMLIRAAAGARVRTPSPCSTTSGSRPRTSPGSRWAA